MIKINVYNILGLLVREALRYFYQNKILKSIKIQPNFNLPV